MKPLKGSLSVEYQLNEALNKLVPVRRRVYRDSDLVVNEAVDRTVEESNSLLPCVRKVLVDAETSAETLQQDGSLSLRVDGGTRFDPAAGSGLSWILTLAHRRAVVRVRVEEFHRIRDVWWGIKNCYVEYDQGADGVIQRAETEVVQVFSSTLTPTQREALTSRTTPV